MPSLSKEDRFFSFKNATILSSPLCILLFWTLITLVVFKLWNPSYSSPLEENLSALLAFPVVYAYYLIPTLGIPYLLWAQIVLVMAWNRSARTLTQRRFLVFYNVVLLIYIGYVVWWYVSGQHFGYL